MHLACTSASGVATCAIVDGRNTTSASCRVSRPTCTHVGVGYSSQMQVAQETNSNMCPCESYSYSVEEAQCKLHLVAARHSYLCSFVVVYWPAATCTALVKPSCTN